MSEVKDIADLESKFLETHRELKDWAEKASGEIEEVGKVSEETKSALDAVSAKGEEYGQRIDELEAKWNAKTQEADRKSIGEMLTDSDEYKAMDKGGRSARIECKAITNVFPASTGQPLVQEDRVGGIVKEPDRRLTIRDVIPTGRTDSNVVFYAKEDVFTNNAGPQHASSPTEIENVLKNESNITFTSAEASVITLAHFILVSRQVLSDAPMLQSYINGRLSYGLKLEEEDEILNSTGTSGELNGILSQAVAYNRGSTGDTVIDTLRKSCTQGELSEYTPNIFVLNPSDWEAIETLKDLDGRYIYGNPGSSLMPQIWGKRVVATNSITQGTFLTAAMSPESVMLWDREDASVEVSREDSDNFRRNMVTILAEERVALTVFRPSAFVTGSI